MARSRRKARTVALQALYEGDMVGHDPEAVLNRLLATRSVGRDTAAYSAHLVRGVIDHRSTIDQVISQTAPAWPLDQLAVVDRNILRLAIFEILVDNKVPVRAAINEAVELAKAFGGENSPKFVNGVLGSVALMAAR